MTIDELRSFCMSFPGATEDIKWGADLCFSVGGKMFTVTSADANDGGLSVKCTPEKFAELIERPGIAPAAYVGRYKWAHLDSADAVEPAELKELIRTSYKLVRDKLPAKIKRDLPGMQ